MHVAPVDLRAIRQSGVVIRFVMLGEMAYVLAEIPPSGSAGTSLEQPCAQAHWGFVIEGELEYVTTGRREPIPAGRAFHVPAGGSEHHFESRGAALVAGFQPVEPELDVSDKGLAAQGFEILTTDAAATIVPAIPKRNVEAGQVARESWPMSGYLLTRVRMGERSGYTAGWCDAPHWGLVTAGRFAIEWEDDVEIVSTGDIFHCPGGPPGHRLEAADPATFVDLTPITVMQGNGRLADWRRGWEDSVHPPIRGIAVAALG
jgi:quercetin dioxygenase-like cupin family protein